MPQMITNVKLSLSKSERCFLANIIDGRHSTRLAKRSEIVDFVTAMLKGTIDKPTATTTGPLTTKDPWQHPLVIKHTAFIKGRLKHHGITTDSSVKSYLRPWTQ